MLAYPWLTIPPSLVHRAGVYNPRRPKAGSASAMSLPMTSISSSRISWRALPPAWLGDIFP